MREPDLLGPTGRAWRMPGAEDRGANLCAWLIESRGWHALITHWAVAVVHLRPLPGNEKPPVLRYPEAEHELLILSLDPEVQVDPDVAESRLPQLMPPEAAEQFHGVGDQGARKVAELVVRAIVNGANPDSDNRAFWRAAIPATVEHFRAGRHGLA